MPCPAGRAGRAARQSAARRSAARRRSARPRRPGPAPSRRRSPATAALAPSVMKTSITIMSRDVRHDEPHVALVVPCMPRRSMSMLPTIRPGDEDAEVAASACRVERRRRSRRRPWQNRDRRPTRARSRPARSRRRARGATPKPTPRRGRDAELLQEVERRGRRPSSLPSATIPANVSASTAPIGSLKADSAMIVCEIFGPHAACARRAGSGSRGRSARGRLRSGARP